MPANSRRSADRALSMGSVAASSIGLPATNARMRCSNRPCDMVPTLGPKVRSSPLSDISSAMNSCSTALRALSTARISCADTVPHRGAPQWLYRCRVHDLLSQPVKGPASKLAPDAGPRSEVFRQVPARRSRPRDPENSIQNKTMVDGLRPFGARGAKMKLS